VIALRARDPLRALDEVRRFAPQTLLSHLERGQEIEAGERHVSVLFADLRDYTAFTDSVRSRDVFAMLSRYAEALADVIQECGGEIVEFAGDGVMAVFGAPRELPSKERAAVGAARRICRIVAQLSNSEPRIVGRSLHPVVGIATGEAFVGGIRAGSRTFWSAVGSITNLAARLQHLTRELDSAIAIDETTWRAAGPVAADLVRRPGVFIRGHGRPEDVFVLPRRAV
jgi:adenylate cyclase